MRRGTIVLALFGLIAAGIIGASTFLQNQPPLTITVAVDPLMKDWATQAINAFNAGGGRTSSGRKITVNITDVRDLQVWRDRAWSSNNHPQAWIASLTASVNYAKAAGYPLEILKPSLAQTPLIWMGYKEDRADTLTANGASPLDWSPIQPLAAAGRWENGDFVNLTFPSPDQTITGLGMLLSGAASYHDAATITNAMLTDRGFRDWMREIIVIPDNTSMPADVGNFVALRGSSTVHLAIGTEAEWLRNYSAITRSGAISFGYPEYTVVFDFPVARWNDAQTTPDEQQAAQALADWLSAPDQQAKLVDFGLRPADSNPEPTLGGLFTAAIDAGINAEPTYTVVQFPNNSADLKGLISWFEDERR